MIVTLRRVERNVDATLGQLSLPVLGASVLWTLEDPATKDKGPIPAGNYPLVLSYSPKFQMLLPELVNVPNFTGVRIHAGNTDADTIACVLVGLYRVSDSEIGASREALGRFLTLWRSWESSTITITEEAP